MYQKVSFGSTKNTIKEIQTWFYDKKNYEIFRRFDKKIYKNLTTAFTQKDTSVEKVISYSNSLKTFLDDSGQTKPILPIFDIPLSCKIRNVLSKFFQSLSSLSFSAKQSAPWKLWNILIK